MKLPVTVVLPTLNCKEKLIRHLEAIDPWLPNVGQIVAIDSRSNDGTYEVLEQRLSPFGAQIISAERGLYQCWNQAAQLATQPYLYYSTICDVISETGLEQLVKAISENNLDVVISPPTIVSETGDPLLDVKWPIHYVADHLNYSGDVAVYEGKDLSCLITFFLPATILGSSASNIYRSRVLKENPFPLNMGTMGDSLWAVKYLPKLRVGISRQSCSTFCWDGDRNQKWDEDGVLMKEFKKEEKLLREVIPLSPGVEIVLKLINEFMRDERERTAEAVRKFLDDDIRKKIAQINEYDDYVRFLTRPLRVRVKDVILKYTSLRYWFGGLFSRR